jgi:hypothetical protein
MGAAMVEGVEPHTRSMRRTGSGEALHPFDSAAARLRSGRTEFRVIVAFLGPSLSARDARRACPGVKLRPPARQGDIWRALEERPKAIALIDGVFETVPSVWHHELRAALASGVAVFGAASMGALRAAELAPFGMLGVGQIYRWYRDGTLTDAGAVALLHAGAEHGWKAMTVPLVNVMHTARTLPRRDAQRLVKLARGIFYQHRTWPELWRRFGRSFPVEDLKALDAAECLKAAHAFVKSKAPAPPVVPLQVSSYVRRRRLVDVHGHKLERLDPALADGGTRTLLLGEWARSLGLTPDPLAVRRFERALALRDPSERLRLARLLALEEQVLAHPERMLPDGPSRLEGLALGALCAGHWR